MPGSYINDFLLPFDYTEITPFIATLDRNTKNVDFDKLKKVGVIGVMIEAGGLYDSIHMENDRYISPKLESQVKEAVNANMNYGLIADVKSKNIDEANKELSELTICVQKYVPPLGVWLNLQLTSSKSINNKIVDRYQFILEKLGLKNKIGLYATPAQLKKIDWNEDRYNTWYLWINKHVCNTDEVNHLLYPEFFMKSKFI